MLRFVLRGRGVDWELLDDTAGSLLKTRRAPDDLSVQFSGQEDESVWSRQSLLDGRLGKTVAGVSASEVWVFLYVRGCEGLMFSQLRVVGTGKGLLFFDEE